MALKKHLNEDEKFGLTQEEIQLAERYLRKNKTAGALRDSEALLLYEMFMIGTSYKDMHLQYPQYSIAQIILPAALRKWGLDRDRMMSSLKDRVRAKVVKSVVESVSFLTSMLSVASVEHMDQMQKYIQDPENNMKPSLRIQSLKDYKECMESLQKLVDGSTGDPKRKSSAMFGALDNTKHMNTSLPKPKEEDPSLLLAEAVEVADGE